MYVWFKCDVRLYLSLILCLNQADRMKRDADDGSKDLIVGRSYTCMYVVRLYLYVFCFLFESSRQDEA